MKYPKINTLWKRDDKTKHIIEGDYAKEEFKNIKRWEATEKIDGMNIRIYFKRYPDSLGAFKGVAFYGRTDNAQIPEELMTHLKNTFTYDKIASIFDEDVDEVWLFGEGYGPKIQNGGGYVDAQQFILFDVVVDSIWLERDSVFDITEKLSVRNVPVISINTMTEDEICEYVKAKHASIIADDEKLIMEGVVCRTKPLMLDRRGNPIFMKLKVKDYED